MHRLAHVTDDDLQLGEAVEHAGGHDPDRMGADLDAIAPHGGVHAVVAQGAAHQVGRGARVDVERIARGLGSLEDRPEFGAVEVVVIGVRVDHHPVELQLANGPLQLFRCTLGSMRGDGGEADEASRMTGDQRRQPVVGQGRHLAGSVGVEHLHARCGQGGDRHVDAVLVRLLDTALVVEQAVEEVHRPVAGLAIIDSGHQAEIGAVGRQMTADLLQLLGDLGDRPGFLGGDLPELAGHAVLL